MALITHALCITDNTKSSCKEYERSADCALFEMQNLYQERLPYVPQEKVGGLCIQWDDVFIALIRYAMSTDCMDQMSASERELWRMFVEFEDNHTPSASTDHCNGNAVGATDYFDYTDENGTVFEGISVPVMWKSISAVSDRFYRWYDKQNDKWHWAIMPIFNMMPQYCLDERALPPTYDVPKAYVYDDLDNLLRSIHDCEPRPECACNDYELYFPHLCEVQKI